MKSAEPMRHYWACRSGRPFSCSCQCASLLVCCFSGVLVCSFGKQPASSQQAASKRPVCSPPVPLYILFLALLLPDPLFVRRQLAGHAPLGGAPAGALLCPPVCILWAPLGRFAAGALQLAPASQPAFNWRAETRAAHQAEKTATKLWRADSTRLGRARARARARGGGPNERATLSATPPIWSHLHGRLACALCALCARQP